MQEPEQEREREAAEMAWKSQEQQGSSEISLTAEKICALARSRERLNAWVKAAVVIFVAALAGGLLYNVYRIGEPWIRLGQAWTLVVLAYLFGPVFERGRGRKGISEPCARFLERQHEERRRDYLHIQRRLFLLIPGMAACWWGRSALAAPGLWLFVSTGAGLVLVWLAFGKAAEKAARDREEVRRSIAR